MKKRSCQLVQLFIAAAAAPSQPLRDYTKEHRVDTEALPDSTSFSYGLHQCCVRQLRSPPPPRNVFPNSDRKARNISNQQAKKLFLRQMTFLEYKIVFNSAEKWQIFVSFHMKSL